MKLLGGLAFLFSLFMGGSAIAQTDSTDLVLTLSDPVLATAEDSLLFPADYYGELSLSFDLDEPDSISYVHVELSDVNSNSIFFRKVWSVSEMSSSGLLSDSTVTINFGNRETERSYRAHLTLVDTEEAYLPTITKIIEP